MLANNIFLLPTIGDPIPSKAAIYLIKHFKETEGWGSSKTKSIVFSIDDLDKIIGQVKKITGGDGVRIYFGKYPANDVPNFPLPDEKYKSRETIVFVPTYKDGTKEHINSFDVEAEVALPDYPQIPPVVTGTRGDDAYNHGQLEP